jgi:hypothetical protein
MKANYFGSSVRYRSDNSKGYLYRYMRLNTTIAVVSYREGAFVDTTVAVNIYIIPSTYRFKCCPPFT